VDGARTSGHNEVRVPWHRGKNGHSKSPQNMRICGTDPFSELGENAIYAGKGKFSGFGAPHKTVKQMREVLLDAYNSGLPAGRRIKLRDIPSDPVYISRPRVR